MRYQIGDVHIVPAARRVLHAGIDVRLGGRAFDLLLALIERRDRVVSKDELVELVWPDVNIEPNNLAFQVWTLRRLLGRQAVATVARRGYQFAAPLREVPDTDLPSLPLTDRGQSAPAAASTGSAEPAGLLSLLQAHRLVTLVSPDADVRRNLARALGEHQATLLPGGTWWLPRCPSMVALHRLVTGLEARSALLVLEDTHLQPRATLALVTAALNQSSAVRLLLTSLHPLGHRLERVYRAPVVMAPVAGVPDLPARLRWRSRCR